MQGRNQRKKAPQADYIDQANESDAEDVQGGSGVVGLDEIQVDLTGGKNKNKKQGQKNEASFKSAVSDTDFQVHEADNRENDEDDQEDRNQINDSDYDEEQSESFASNSANVNNKARNIERQATVEAKQKIAEGQAELLRKEKELEEMKMRSEARAGVRQNSMKNEGASASIKRETRNTNQEEGKKQAPEVPQINLKNQNHGLIVHQADNPPQRNLIPTEKLITTKADMGPLRSSVNPPTAKQYKEALLWMDSCFKYDKFLTDLSGSYLVISMIEILTYFIMAIFFNQSIWYVFLHSAHPIRGFVGFYLYFIIPSGQELFDHIDYSKFKNDGSTQRPNYQQISSSITEDVRNTVTEQIEDFSKGAKIHLLLSAVALVFDIISFLVFLIEIGGAENPSPFLSFVQMCFGAIYFNMSIYFVLWIFYQSKALPANGQFLLQVFMGKTNELRKEWKMPHGEGLPGVPSMQKKTSLTDKANSQSQSQNLMGQRGRAASSAGVRGRKQ